MMNELACRLKWGRHLCDMTHTEAEAIIKALRFAADMEKLKKAWVDVEIVWIRAEDRVSLIASSADNRFLPFAVEESDIYTAARKAVEELEKGD